MDSDPLVPKPLSGVSKFLTYGIAFFASLFIIATVIMTLIEGAKVGRHGFIIIGITLAVLALSVVWLIRLVNHDQSLDEKMKYFAIGQSACILMLCIAVWIAIFEPQPGPGPNRCVLSSLFTGASSTCYGISEFTNCYDKAPFSQSNSLVCMTNQLCTNCSYGNQF